METVSTQFREQEYSGEALFNSILRINNNLVPVQQIASIKIKSPIIDTSTETFYVGSFISQTLTIKFKNLDGLDIQSKNNVHLEIGQSINGVYEYLLMGEYLIDDLAENYQETCEITCMDYAIKFKPNIDYSPCFTNGTASVSTIVQYICNYFDVTLGSDLLLLPNNDVVVGTYDSTISGKQWLSYIAEIMGCNLKMSRDGKLLFLPFKKDEPDIEINALKSAEWELGEKYEISQVVYFDAIRNFTYGDNEANTLFIRQDNPFITDTNVVKNIYESLIIKTPVELEEDTSIELDLETRYRNAKIELKGNTYQQTYTGKNLLNNIATTTSVNGITFTKYSDGTVKVNGTASGTAILNLIGNNSFTLSAGNYVLSGSPSGGSDNTYRLDINDGASIPEAGRTLRDFGSGRIFTLSSSITVNNVRIRIASGTTINNLLFKPMIEKGTSKTEYEPYVGEIPSPNPDYPQNIEVVTGYNEVEVVGKNLFDNTLIEDNKFQNASSNNTSIVNNNSYFISGFQKIKPSTTYTYNTDVTYGTFYNENKQAIISAFVTSNTFTTPANAKYVVVNFAKSSVSVTDNIQLEEGNQATTYEPYQSQSYEINLGKNLLNLSNFNTITDNSGITLTNDTTTGKVTLNGTANVNTFITYTTQTFNTGNIVSLSANNSITNSDVSIRLYNLDNGHVTTNAVLNVINKKDEGITLNEKYNGFQIRIASGTTLNNFELYPQVELGSSVTSYSSYKTPIELCKIEEYQDYIYKENDKWYKMPNVLKIDSYNGEIITTDYLSTTGQLTTGATIYYGNINPTAIEITDNELIEQLNALENIELYEGINNINTETNNLEPYLKLSYNSIETFKIWSLKNKNYGDISLDAWDLIKFNLGDESYLTYNDNIITYEMNIATEINTQIPTKQKEVTTNVIGGDEQTKIKMLKTNLDYVNNKIELLLNETDNLTERTNQLVLDILSTQNIFQITGGSNLINNSQFLYANNDNEFWTLTNNGSNPYNNMGNGYDANLIGKTTSVSKIQLRDTILTSSNTNITNLKQNQQYTLNYSYKQDNLTTSKVELIETISGNKVFEKTYNEQIDTITNETIPFIAEETAYIFKVTTSTTSGGTGGYFYIYDLMLNSGDKKNWEPAKSEVYSTVVKMSQMGLSVVAVGSNIITLLTSQGFQVRKYSNDQIGEIITEFTDKGIVTKDIDSTSISTGKYISTELMINGVEHHVEYFKE